MTGAAVRANPGYGVLSGRERTEKEEHMERLWNADLGNGMYQNPILHTDYSDPDVIRVGEDYYMISSSFTYIPGVPVLHSRDLVSWELINYVVREIPFKRYDLPAHGAGTWAPALRYHEGVFYAFIPMPDEGIFVSKSSDPAGEWSPMKAVKRAKGWIDPCPFWDEDGRAYMAFAYAKTRCGIKHRISVCEMDPAAESLIGEPVLVYEGVQANPTIEGPKVYKRNGWYYIFAPAGGVPTGWQTVLRSRSVFGPYESKIVMHQGDTKVNGPHQGGYVETPDGKGWFIHFQDRDMYGRIAHLQPLCWNGDWPFIGTESNGDGIGEPVAEWEKPIHTDWRPNPIPAGDEFEGPDLGLQWQWQANPKREWYSLTRESHSLTLFCLANPMGRSPYLWYAPNACTQMLQAPAFVAEAEAVLRGDKEGDLISMGILGYEYTYLALEKGEKGNRICLRRGSALRPEQLALQENSGQLETLCPEFSPLEAQALGIAAEKVEETCEIRGDRVRFRITMRDSGAYSYEYSPDGKEFLTIGAVYQAKKAVWTGAKFVLYGANRENQNSGGYGSFRYVRFWTEK